MTRQTCIGRGVVLLVLAGLSQSVQADFELQISCEGVESGGGGSTLYQYTLQNVSGAELTLNVFYLGTNDLDSAHYANWVAPAGFDPIAIVGDWATLEAYHAVSVMYTTQQKDPHGSSIASIPA